MERGYIALWRKVQDHPFYKEKRVFSKYEAWNDLLMEAQHCEEPKDVVIGMKVLQCNYGESLKSVKTWSLRWSWTESKVRRFFKLLKKMGQIRQKSEGLTTRISIINYNLYDPKRRKNGEQTTETRRGRDGDATTDNNVKNEKNDNKDIPDKIFSLKKRYTDQGLVERIFDALKSTRKTGQISDSVLLAQLEKWKRYPVHQVEDGFATYLDKDCAGAGKDESYLLGIIRNSTKGKRISKNGNFSGNYKKSSTEDKENTVF